MVRPWWDSGWVSLIGWEWWKGLLAAFVNDVRRDEDDKFLFLVEPEGAGEELAQERDVSEERDLGVVLGLLGLD